MITKKLLTSMSLGTLVVLLAACGPKPTKSNTAKLIDDEEDDVDLVEHLTGIDGETHVEVEEEETALAQQEAEPDPTEDENYIGGTQGAFLGTLKVNGEEAKGTFTVRTATADAETVMEDIRAGSEITLDPGMYDFIFVTDKVAGSPEFTLRDVEIPQGRRVVRDVKIPVGQITLVTGKKCAKRPIKIKPKGATDWYPGNYSTCKPLLLLAGTYEAEMGSGKRATPISGIQVYDGGIRSILIRGKAK